MHHRVVTDAIVATSSPPNRRLVLKQLHDQLVKRDLHALKFLCSDFLPALTLEKINTPLDLFVQLEHECKISPQDNFSFLAELLYRIGCHDLLQHILFTKDDVQRMLAQSGSQLSSYRLLLKEICDELTNTDLESLKYLCTEFSQCTLANIKQPTDLICALEHEALLSSQHLQYFCELLASLKRHDLVTKIHQYQNVSTNSANNISSRAAAVDMSSSHVVEWTKYTSQHTQPAEPARSQVMAAVQPVMSGVTSPPVHSVVPPLVPPAMPLVDPDELPSYSMTRKPRGICLIINNEKFCNDDNSREELRDRAGTNVDCENLKRVFKALNFNVQVYRDLTEQQMVEHLHYFARTVDHSSRDCFIACILSHGTHGAIYGVNGKTVAIRDLMYIFTGGQCPSLRGKPKIFFIQACQGKERQTVVAMETDGPEDCKLMETIPNEADFLLAYATVPGSVAYRHPTHGTWYITTLCQQLENMADRHDLLSILIKVNEEVSRETAAMPDGLLCKQSPAPMATLRKKIFFR